MEERSPISGPEALESSRAEDIYSWERHEPVEADDNCPPPRAHHVSALSRNKLYIYGGITAQPETSAGTPLIYTYCLDKQQWNKSLTKSSFPAMHHFKCSYGVIVGSRFFALGENSSGEGSGLVIWRLNLDTLEWLEVEQRGELP
jgi:hypothetical protein